MSGIECISDVVREMKSQVVISRDARVASRIADCMDQIGQCVANMKNTNAFMLMTINRCIDYTKASKGLKLIPKFETIDLMDTLLLPLNCMKDIQQRVAIHLFPIPDEVCSHIITDRQWLQENLLCLLSNAVKYSHEGIVTIKIELHYRERDMDEELLKTSEIVDEQNVEGGNYYTWRDPKRNKQEKLLDRYSNKPKEDVNSAMKEYLRVEVEDTGIGLSEDAMETLFNPFRQAQRLAGGTGLGLYSLAQRIEALQGRCGVSKRRDGGEGSLFWFEVPYRPDHQFARHLVSKRVADRSGSVDFQASVRNPNRVGETNYSRTFVPELSKPPLAKIDSMAMTVQTDVNGHIGSLLEEIQRKPTTQPPSIVATFESLALGVQSDRNAGGDVDHGEEDVISVNLQEPNLSGRSRPANKPKVLISPLELPDAISQEPPETPVAVTAITTTVMSAPTPTPTATTAATPSTTTDSPVPVASDGFPSGLEILLVDDSPAILKMTSMMLKRCRHNVTTATNGVEAIKAVQDCMQIRGDSNNPFDVILMDLQMPVMDGLEAMKRLRALERSSESRPMPVHEGYLDNSSHQHQHFRSHMIIIGVSANSDPETAAQAYRMGANGFMSKPFLLETFYLTYERIRYELMKDCDI